VFCSGNLTAAGLPGFTTTFPSLPTLEANAPTEYNQPQLKQILCNGLDDGGKAKPRE